MNRLHKYLILTLINLLFCSSALYSQENTGKDKVNQEPDSALRYVNSMEYAFMMHEDTRWLLKASLVLTRETVNVIPFSIAFERRISKSFTANAAIDHMHVNLPGKNEYLLPLNFSLESRWYYRLKKRIREEGVAVSMSDNYLALGMAYTYLLNYNNVDVSIESHYLSLYSKWGIQRRYLKYGHVDLGIKAGMMDAVDNSFNPSLVLNTYVNMGLGFSKDKTELDREKLCPFLRCYEADRFLIKSNLSNLINLGIFTNDKWFECSPQFVFEKKLGTSTFSLSAEVSGTFGYSEFTDDDDQFTVERYWIAGLILEGRYYYNLKKSIRSGRSGNGLSGNYVAAGGGYYFVDDQQDKVVTDTGPQLFAATGWQRLLSKHLYFDIEIGVNYYFEPNRFQNLFGPFQKLALGYRF